MFRPRGFVLRDEFGDVLKGLVSREEAMDMEEVQPTTSHKLANTLKERLKGTPTETVDPEPEAIDAEEVQPEPKPPATSVRRRTATKPTPDAQPGAAARRRHRSQPRGRLNRLSETWRSKALHRRLVDHDVVIGDVMKRFGVETFRELTDEQIAGSTPSATRCPRRRRRKRNCRRGSRRRGRR